MNRYLKTVIIIKKSSQMIKIRNLIGLLAVPLLFSLSGCYPDKIDYVDEYDIAATHVLEDADFSEYTTFAVADTVIHMTEDGEDDPNLSRQHDEFIIAELRQNMLDLNYVEVESPDSINKPDIVLLASAVSNTYYYYYYYYYYWGWYPYWGYYPGYGDIDPDWGVEPDAPVAVPMPEPGFPDMGMPDMGGMDFGGFDF